MPTTLRTSHVAGELLRVVDGGAEEWSRARNQISIDHRGQTVELKFGENWRHLVAADPKHRYRLILDVGFDQERAIVGFIRMGVTDRKSPTARRRHVRAACAFAYNVVSRSGRAPSRLSVRLLLRFVREDEHRFSSHVQSCVIVIFERGRGDAVSGKHDRNIFQRGDGLRGRCGERKHATHRWKAVSIRPRSKGESVVISDRDARYELERLNQSPRSPGRPQASVLERRGDVVGCFVESGAAVCPPLKIV